MKRTKKASNTSISISANTLILGIVFAILYTVFYLVPIEIPGESATIFLTVSTFIFAIQTGFFISRQNSR